AVAARERFRSPGRACAWPRVARQPDVEARAFAGHAVHRDIAAMGRDDLERGCETQPIALRARGEEWLEDLLAGGGIHAAPIVRDRNHRIAAGRELGMFQS